MFQLYSFSLIRYCLSLSLETVFLFGTEFQILKNLIGITALVPIIVDHDAGPLPSIQSLKCFCAAGLS